MYNILYYSLSTIYLRTASEKKLIYKNHKFDKYVQNNGFQILTVYKKVLSHEISDVLYYFILIEEINASILYPLKYK